MKIKSEIASTNIDAYNEKFSDEALKQIADQCIGKPVLYEFDHNMIIGKITNKTIDKNKIIIEAELQNDKLHRYLTVGFRSKNFNISNDIRVINDIELICVGLTNYPSDKSLSKIEVIEE